MSASLLRIRLIVLTLLGQSRYLLIGLVSWPFVLTLILFAADSGYPTFDDAQSILHQELFYGLVLVGLGASTALGTEERAHRTQQILGRAAKRKEYLLGLGLSAYLPFLGYLGAWITNALAISAALHRTPADLGSFLVCELAAGLLIGAVGLLCSVVLPQLVAATVTGLCLSLLLFVGAQPSPGWLSVFGSLSSGSMATRGILKSVELTAVGAALLITWACILFKRRDLRGL